MMLEVGMKIYSTDAASILKITRVTKCLAMAKKDGGDYEYVFNRDIGDRTMFRERGAYDWSVACYSLETPELIAQRRRLVLENRYSKIDASKLTIGQLEDILKIAVEAKA